MSQLESFLKEIKDLNYVVQRNWELLPEGFVEGHEDLDLFTTEKDKPKLLEIAKKYPEIKIDIRSYSDWYYPPNIGTQLLTNRVLEKDLFWIPNDFAHFISLYYHDWVHKGGGYYTEKLRDIFIKIYTPTKCKDEGVGFYGPH
jgi:hypothetical protein